jgi:septum formation protein
MATRRTIILASASRARRKLLKGIGLKFRVSVSKVKEGHHPRAGCARLVTRNSLKKAQDVAKRFPKGVVIAADTIVLAGGRIIGKPRSLKDAFRMLKYISRRPQWVYTGITVIDIDKGRTFTDYDKTKVCMCPLNDAQIKNYFRKAPPLGRAGSFDIQGLGGLFIDRIEGCFYNVVGLPLAKLARILRKVGIEIF